MGLMRVLTMSPQNKIRNDETTAREGSQVDDDGLEGMANDCTKGEDSPRSTQLYMQEELVILTHKIFRDEDEKDMGRSGTTRTVHCRLLLPGVDHQVQESDTGEQSGESEGGQTRRSS